MRLYLCGFMGAGKSTLLSELSVEGDDSSYWDLDHELFCSFGMGHENLGDYIESLGWEEFRALEQRHLMDLRSRSENFVMALGGGAISEEMLGSLDQNDKLIWLDTSFATCWERIVGSKRPLIKLGKERLLELYDERVKLYMKASLKLDEKKQKLVNTREQLIKLLNC